MGVREDADLLLGRLAEHEERHPQYKREHVPLDILKANVFDNMDPKRLNDAVSLLEEAGFVEAQHTFGTTPFDFSELLLTIRGKAEAERGMSGRVVSAPAGPIPARLKTERIGRWQVVKRLQGGAQADVFLVRDMTGLLDSSQRNSALDQAVSILTAHGSDGEQRAGAVSSLLTVVEDVAREQQVGYAVLKRLRSPQEKRKARLRQEISALRKLKHHAIVRLIDSDAAAGWLTMPYYSGGTLTPRPKGWANDVAGALQAIRPIAEALAEVHHLGFVHRDVKPDNIFLSDDGSMVLGDFGLAIEAESSGRRLTSPEERVGSEDWMPPWARMRRLDEVKPTFDVYCLGKVIWAMLTGQAALPHRYDYDPAYMLQTSSLEGANDSFWVERILRRIVVESESQMEISNGQELLGAIDDVLAALHVGAQRFTGRRKCHVCGTGHYVETTNVPWALLALSTPGPHLIKLFRCSDCGHIQHFLFEQRLVPPAWSE